MKKYIIMALQMFALLSFICGILYPLMMTGIAQVVFPYQANGSVLKQQDGTQIGSALIGQNFKESKFFHGRPSVTNYGTTPSGASNRSPAILKTEIAARAQALNLLLSDIPADLLMSSGSGLDPHISQEAAELQVKRVAKARLLAEKDVLKLIHKMSYRQLPLEPEPSTRLVNVLELNMALEGKMLP